MIDFECSESSRCDWTWRMIFGKFEIIHSLERPYHINHGAERGSCNCFGWHGCQCCTDLSWPRIGFRALLVGSWIGSWLPGLLWWFIIFIIQNASSMKWSSWIRMKFSMNTSALSRGNRQPCNHEGFQKQTDGQSVSQFDMCDAMQMGTVSFCFNVGAENKSPGQRQPWKQTRSRQCENKRSRRCVTSLPNPPKCWKSDDSQCSRRYRGLGVTTKTIEEGTSECKKSFRIIGWSVYCN